MIPERERERQRVNGGERQTQACEMMIKGVKYRRVRKKRITEKDERERERER